MELIEAMRAGDERAFEAFIARHHTTMFRVARSYVPCDAVAEEVVQETWGAVLAQLDRFEERSAVKTWIFRILINRAKTRGERERRTVPFSCLSTKATGDGPDEREGFEDRLSADAGWSSTARPWQNPERRLLSLEAREVIRTALADLPERQRVVVTLRDVEGVAAEEVCELLNISLGNQRVLLHRGRAHLRTLLGRHLSDQGPEDVSGTGGLAAVA
jgi:RNA polymerase sigma-70 factor (ECF subfamily)